MTHSADQLEKSSVALTDPAPASSPNTSAHAPPCHWSAVSACSAAARSFSPLCFTDSGFNSDSTQYPADGAAPEQVSSSNYSSSLDAPSPGGLPPVYGPGSYPPSSSFFARLFPLGATGHAIRVVLCVCVGVWRRRALQSHTGDGGF